MGKRIVITGAAGLVGQNLVARLIETPGLTLVAIDKHPANTAILRRLHPGMEVIEADLSLPGPWEAAFAGADAVVVNQAQIGGLDRAEYIANNVAATERVLEAMARARVPYMVGISSSVVNSRAQDLYVETKTLQEKLYLESGIPCAVLRPTLMFGWFDRKHLGWLARFLRKSPVFPIPGSGRFTRQPLFVQDFCSVILSCLENPDLSGCYDITGLERISYLSLMRELRRSVKSRGLFIHLPIPLFGFLLQLWALISRQPAFTRSQLQALTAGDEFDVIDWPTIFAVSPTPLSDALRISYNDPRYASVEIPF